MANTCKHGPDSAWETDLIWHYFHQISTEAKPVGHWYKQMDSSGELNDRHRIYEMLLNESDLTLDRGKSKIPWNQNNADFLKTVKGKLYCGSMIKIVFTRYMGWKNVEPKSLDIGKRGFDAAGLVIASLRDKKPVRVSLGGHYVGVVGHRCRPAPGPAGTTGCSPQNEFLCLEPWAGGSATGGRAIKYAGKDTCFLGIIQQDGSSWKYDDHIARTVEFEASWLAKQKNKARP